MAGPFYDSQMQRWGEMIGYIKRGTEGEAGLELNEAVQRHKLDELGRWKVIVNEFPFAITGLDPAESLRPENEKCQLFGTFVNASHEWLKKEFAGRENEYWEEMASFGCYWIRFKSESDLTKYKDAFSNELKALDFEGPKNERA